MTKEHVLATSKDILIIGIAIFVGGSIVNLWTGWIQSTTNFLIGSILLFISAYLISPKSEDATHIDWPRIRGYMAACIGAYFLLGAA